MTPLRVMPFGDSITRGLIIPEPGVVPGGYRTRLHERLIREWGPVEFVGSADDNPDPRNLPSPRHEGHGGCRIDELAAGVDEWMAAARPNLVLLHAGTNDMVQDHEVDSAPQRLNDLLARIPGAIYLARIIGSTDPTVHERIARFNAALPDVVRRHDAVLVDMFAAVPLTAFADPYHPNAAGYRLMADAWFEAIVEQL